MKEKLDGRAPKIDIQRKKIDIILVSNFIAWKPLRNTKSIGNVLTYLRIFDFFNWELEE